VKRDGCKARGRLLTGGLTMAAAGLLVTAFAIAVRPAAAVTGGGPLSGTAVTAAASSAIRSAPTAPPARICDNRPVLYGPRSAPGGAVRVPAGDNENFNFSRKATFWFAAGTHTLGPGEYAQIHPVSGSTYLGAPGAVLDGRHKNHYAFGGSAAHVTIQNLAIEYFGFNSADNQQQGVVNHDSASYWTITRSSIAANAGAGVMMGSHNTLSYDCIKQNAQYGFNAYSPDGPAGITITHSEIAGNDSFDYEAKQPGCGCSGGGKFWAVNGAVVTSNYVHDNKSVGLWADTNNRGFQFEGNYISGNESTGLMYEISYNAVIEWNAFVRNGVSGGPQSRGFPTSAIYISESGSDPRVPTPYNTRLLIGANIFTDNWGGVILWENANRFCASPDNTSTSECTLVNPSLASLSACGTPALIAVAPYISDCRWKVQNVVVTNNTLNFNPAAVGRSCQQSKDTCGFNGLFSEYGSDPPWSPYLGNLVPDNLTYHQNNHFQSNRYHGPWQFMIWEQGTTVSWNGWRAGPYQEDAGSTMRRT
jgi:Right handed beta helix region